MTSTRLLTVLAVLLVVPTNTGGQSDIPRTPWGAPNLQGIWLYWASTPLERPEEFGDSTVVTPEEAALFVARRYELFFNETNGDWNPTTGLVDGRTSLLIDPPNGRLPARTETGQHRANTVGLPPPLRSADGPEDRDRWERCIMGRSVPFFPMPWDQRIRVVQSPDHIALQAGTSDLPAPDGPFITKEDCAEVLTRSCRSTSLEARRVRNINRVSWTEGDIPPV